MEFNEISDDQVREMEYKGFELDPTDKHNISEIKKMLEFNGYKTEEQVMSHLHYLEALADKMEDAYKIELPVRNNLILLAEIRSVKKLNEKLMALLENF
jgi:hypothetical protein